MGEYIDDKLVDVIMKYLPEISLTLATIATGVFLILDDKKDFGKTDRIWHHVYTGLIPFIGGLSSLAYITNEILTEYHGAPLQKSPKAPENPLKRAMEFAPEILQLMR